MSLRIEWLDEPERFAGLAADWDRMLPGDARPFDLHPWYSAWYRAFGEPGSMRVCLAWEDDRLRAAFPLVERPRRSLAGMANVHTPVFRPVGSSPEAVRAVVEAALARGSGNLELPAIPAGDPSLILLREATAAGRSAPGDRDPARVADRRHDRDLRGLADAVQAALGRAARALPPQDGARSCGRALDRGGA